MARIPYADVDGDGNVDADDNGNGDGDTAIGELVAQIRRERGGRVLNLYRMLLHSPPVARGWLAMFTAIRQQAVLSGRARELAILRVAVINGADYEFAQHVPFALREGVTPRQVDALRVGAVPDGFDDRDRAVLDYAEAMTRNIRVPDSVFERIRALFDKREIVELTATVGGYNLVSRFLEAMQIDHES